MLIILWIMGVVAIAGICLTIISIRDFVETKDNQALLYTVFGLAFTSLSLVTIAAALYG